MGGRAKDRGRAYPPVSAGLSAVGRGRRWALLRRGRAGRAPFRDGCARLRCRGAVTPTRGSWGLRPAQPRAYAGQRSPEVKSSGGRPPWEKTVTRCRPFAKRDRAGHRPSLGRKAAAAPWGLWVPLRGARPPHPRPARAGPAWTPAPGSCVHPAPRALLGPPEARTCGPCDWGVRVESPDNCGSEAQRSPRAPRGGTGAVLDAGRAWSRGGEASGAGRPAGARDIVRKRGDAASPTVL